MIKRIAIAVLAAGLTTSALADEKPVELKKVTLKEGDNDVGEIKLKK